MGKGTKDPRKPSKAYIAANPAAAAAAAAASAPGKVAKAYQDKSKGKGEEGATSGTAALSTATPTSGKASDAKPVKSGKDRRKVFRQIVKELGGDDADVEMLADVDEDDEVVKKADKALKKDNKVRDGASSDQIGPEH